MITPMMNQNRPRVNNKHEKASGQAHAPSEHDTSAYAPPVIANPDMSIVRSQSQVTQPQSQMTQLQFELQQLNENPVATTKRDPSQLVATAGYHPVGGKPSDESMKSTRLLRDSLMITYVNLSEA
jgi:hypothetical protein